MPVARFLVCIEKLASCLPPFVYVLLAAYLYPDML